MDPKDQMDLVWVPSWLGSRGDGAVGNGLEALDFVADATIVGCDSDAENSSITVDVANVYVPYLILRHLPYLYATLCQVRRAMLVSSCLPKGFSDFQDAAARRRRQTVLLMARLPLPDPLRKRAWHLFYYG